MSLMDAVKKAPLSEQKEAIAWMAAHMSAASFMAEMAQSDMDELLDELQPNVIVPELLPDNANRLYDAICEGRRDDAIEIITEITGERFRSIREQHNLFPDRVPA